MMTISIYTDGALRRQPVLIGAWCCLVLNKNMAQLKSHIEKNATITNNRMELTAVINGLKLCPAKAHIQLYTDSQYVIYGINYGNTKTNQDLWQQFNNLITSNHFNLVVHHVYGHQNNIGNNVVDLTMRHMLNMVIKQKIVS